MKNLMDSSGAKGSGEPASSIGDAGQGSQLAGSVPTALMLQGCEGHHDPNNGPKLPQDASGDSSFDFEWDDRSCKQQQLLSDLDDAMSMRCLQPTPCEVYRLLEHFRSRADLQGSIHKVITYFGQPEVESDCKLLLKQVMEGLMWYPKWLGFPAVLGTSEFTLCKCLLGIARSNGPGNVDPTELCFCLPETSLMIYGCPHFNLGHEDGVAIYNTRNYNIGCNNCSKCLRCKRYLDQM